MRRLATALLLAALAMTLCGCRFAVVESEPIRITPAATAAPAADTP